MKKKWRNLGLAIGALALVGCIDGFDNEISNNNPDAGSSIPAPDAAPATQTDRAGFEANVAPILMARCSDAECHTGPGTSPLKFLGVTNTMATYYDSVEIYSSVHGEWNKNVATMLTKIAGGHQDITYLADEMLKIQTWLDTEKDLRSAGPAPEPGGVITSAQAKITWAGCMTLADWNQTDMGGWSNRATSEGACSNCHNDGAYRMNTNDDDADMFSFNRQEVFIQGFFSISIDVASGNAFMIADHAKLTRMSNGGGAGGLHPTFNYNPDSSYYQRLDEFTLLTQNRLSTLGCPQATAGNPLSYPPPPL